MKHKCVKQKMTKNQVIANQWDSAILEARSRLLKARLRVTRLEGALQHFIEMRKCGEPWPGVATQN